MATLKTTRAVLRKKTDDDDTQGETRDDGRFLKRKARDGGDAPHVIAANPYPADGSREYLRFSAREAVNDGVRATKLAIPSRCRSKGQQ